MFSNDVNIKLLNIKRYYKPHRKRFIKFPLYYVFKLKEEANYEFENKDEIKLYGLAKYWNLVNYFDPNKELAKESWDEVLYDFIPKVLNASNISEYHIILLELTAELNDTHATYPGSYSPNVDRYLYNDYILHFPFQIYICNNNVIVYKIDSSTSKKYGLNCGDTITEIDGKTTLQIIEYYSQYIGASNINQPDFFIKNFIAHGRNITVKKGSQFIKKEIESSDNTPFDTIREKTLIKFLNDSTGYFYMYNIPKFHLIFIHYKNFCQ